MPDYSISLKDLAEQHLRDYLWLGNCAYTSLNQEGRLVNEYLEVELGERSYISLAYLKPTKKEPGSLWVSIGGIKEELKNFLEFIPSPMHNPQNLALVLAASFRERLSSIQEEPVELELRVETQSLHPSDILPFLRQIELAKENPRIHMRYRGLS